MTHSMVEYGSKGFHFSFGKFRMTILYFCTYSMNIRTLSVNLQFSIFRSSSEVCYISFDANIDMKLFYLNGNRENKQPFV